MLRTTVFSLAMALVTGAAFGDVAYKSFRLQDAQGPVEVRTSLPGNYSAAAADSVLKLGDYVRTGAGGRVTVVLDDSNRFTLGPETSLRIRKGSQDGKSGALLLGVEEGRVRVELNDYPADQGFKLQTPAGTYTVVGTIFTVAYELLPSGQMSTDCTCERGEVQFDANQIGTPAVTATAGLSILATIGEAASVYEITAVDNDVLITVSGGHEFTTQSGSTVRIAVTNEFDQPTFIVMDVVNGSATVGDEPMGAADVPRYVSGSTLLDQPGADTFLAAAQTEAEASAALQDPALTDAERTELEAQQTAAQTTIDESVPATFLGATDRPPYVPFNRLADTSVVDDEMSPGGVP